MAKSANWKVMGIEKERLYEVRDTKKRHIVDGNFRAYHVDMYVMSVDLLG